MTDHTYKLMKNTGTSPIGVEDVVNNAIAKAAKTVHKLRGFEVSEIRRVGDGEAVSHWQVTNNFTLDA